MKEIIYLDTNFLNSFLAQTNDGLPTTKNREESEEIKDMLESSKGNRSQSSIETVFKSGDFEIPLVFKSPSGEVKGVWKPGDFSEEKAIASQTEFAKQIISTQMHDNALEKFLLYLDENNLLDVENKEEIGVFIKTQADFKIIDFDYLNRIINPDVLSKLIFEELEKEIKVLQNQLDQTPKQQKSSKEFQQLKTQVTAELTTMQHKKQDILKEIKLVEDILKYLNNILPYSTFLIMDKIIVPLKPNFLRESGEELFFKYDNNGELKITLLGKRTTIINNIDIPNLSPTETVLQLHKLIYVVLNSLNLIKKGDQIVSPIAIYFE